MSKESAAKMIEKKIPSAYPYWTVGELWLAYSLVLPLYKMTHFVIVAVLSVAVFFIAKKVFPPKVILVEAPKEPVYSGKFNLSSLEREYLEKLRAADDNIDNEKVSESIRAISELSKSIFEYVSDKPERVNEIRKFTSYYLPTTIKILDAYERMEEQKIKGDNITKTLESIEKTLANVEKAFEHQLDSLYSAEKLDIETDIEVMEALLAQEGIGSIGSDNIELHL